MKVTRPSFRERSDSLAGRCGRSGHLAALAVAVLLAAGMPSAAYSASAGPAVQGGQVSIDVGSNPDGIAVDATTDTIYVANKGSDNVSVIDGLSDTVTATITVGSDPVGIAVDATTDTIYVANSGDQTVSVIDGATNKVTSTPTVGADPDAVAVDEATDTIYVSWHEGIATIDGATNAVTPLAIDMPPVMGTGINDSIALDPVTGDLYLVNWLLSFVSVIDMSTDQPVSTFDAGGWDDAVAVDAVHGLLYVGGCTSGYSGIWVIDLTTGATKAQPSQSCATAVAADTQTATGVALDQSAGTLSFIDGSPYQVGGSMDAGSGPSAVAADPATGVIYVADGTLDGTVTAITPERPQLTSATAAAFAAGKHGSFQVTATAYPAATYSETGKLPGGVTMSSAGLISGTPAAGSGGKYNLVITASNPVLPAATQDFTLTVTQPARLTAHRNAQFTIGRAETIKITATGFPIPRLTERGKLPGGLVFKAAANGTATISGTARRSDTLRTYVLTITATNGIGKPAVQTLDLTVR